MKLEAPIPVFRIFDVSLAKAFYCDWLGFTVDWDHQFGPNMPHYLQVSRGLMVLHLSEHYGDCTPGSRIFVKIDDVRAFQAALRTRPNPNMNPGIEEAPWKALVMEVIDPFGNRISFNQMLPA